MTTHLAPGELVQLTDNKGRHHTITLTPGAVFHTHKGGLPHDELIGRPEGCVVTSTGGMPYLALRPILEDYVLSMGRGAAIIYPKDAFAIVGLAGIGPGSTVVEAGAGSGALTCFLLTAVGPTGRVISYEIRPEFAEVARRNVQRWFTATGVTSRDEDPPGWRLRVGDLADGEAESADAIILDMLAPWDCVAAAARILRPGGRLIGYVATTTQLSRLAETLRADARWTELKVGGMHCGGCARRIKNNLAGVDGIYDVEVDLAGGTVKIASAPDQDARALAGPRIAALGYQVAE